MNRLGELFNEYHQEFIDCTEPTGLLIDKEITVRLRLFGSDQEKQAAWKAEHPDAGDNIFAMSVSSNPPEIWMDLRKDGNWKLVVNPLVLGHELIHCLRIVLSDWTLNSEDPASDGSPLLSPDRYINL